MTGPKKKKTPDLESDDRRDQTAACCDRHFVCIHVQRCRIIKTFKLDPIGYRQLVYRGKCWRSMLLYV